MKRTIRGGLAILACATFCSVGNFPANAQEETDGPSRGQLFSLFVRTPAEESLGILGTALPFSFRFPMHVREDGIFGIDVSHHNEDFCNCQIDWNVVSNQKISFAYLKATQGTLFRDKKFLNNWNTLEKHRGIHRGAYHFLSSRHDPIDQAKNFLSLVGPLQAKDLPPCLDIEWDMQTIDGEQRDAWADLSSDEIVERALKWLKEVETATGRIPIIYTSNAWWKARVKEDKMALFERYPIWIADYSEKGLGQEKPSVPNGRNWAMWQFTEKGLLDQGLPGHVDANIFKGTITEFRQTFGIVLAATTPDTTNSTTSTPSNPGGTGSSPGGSGAPNTPVPTPNGSMVPNSQPGKDSNLGKPNDGNAPAIANSTNTNSASGGANDSNTTTTNTNAANNANRGTPRRSNKIDDDSGWSLRGGPEIRIE